LALKGKVSSSDKALMLFKAAFEKVFSDVDIQLTTPIISKIVDSRIVNKRAEENYAIFVQQTQFQFQTIALTD
jgi:methionine aminopeptidase